MTRNVSARVDRIGYRIGRGIGAGVVLIALMVCSLLATDAATHGDWWTFAVYAGTGVVVTFWPFTRFLRSNDRLRIVVKFRDNWEISIRHSETMPGKSWVETWRNGLRINGHAVDHTMAVAALDNAMVALAREIEGDKLANEMTEKMREKTGERA